MSKVEEVRRGAEELRAGSGRRPLCETRRGGTVSGCGTDRRRNTEQLVAAPTAAPLAARSSSPRAATSPRSPLAVPLRASPLAVRAECLRPSSLPGAMNVTELRRMADQGVAGAQYALGVCCRHGENMPQDDAEAAFLFRCAADQGHLGAQYDSTICYRDGAGLR
ncbi:hypothetical protein T492DRAFT_883512 [Pavlovales sp. CCMP2436]|nr:hypothetical protein T492DRAFT_883512 [Pavlovales sp. CCMP2436]